MAPLNTGTLKVTTPTDREIVMTRVFNAPRELVFEALTKPELVKRWLGVFGGWSLVVCEIDLRVGGKYRYVWNGTGGQVMGMGGVYREIVAPERVVATERFDESWYPGEAVDTYELTEHDGKTTLVSRVLYDTKEIRDEVLKSPMEHGVATSYDTMESVVLASLLQESK